MADRDTLRKIQALTQSGDVTQAANLAEEALATGLEHPFLLNLVAVKREHEGRPEAAADLLRRALEIAPNDIGCRYALGILLNRLETPHEALEHFDAVIAAHRDFAPAHACRGAALEALGVLDAAAEAYRRAIDLQGGNLIALSGLASLHSRRGEHADARQFAEQVLRVEPNFPNAVMSLAAADVAAGAAEKAETLLRGLLSDPRPTRLEKALARSALGDALDAQGRFREAFDAYASANEERRAIYERRFANERTTLELAQAMAGYFQRTPRDSWQRSAPQAVAPSGARGHVFLIGFPRSGTTLLEQVLASHADVEALEERETLIDGVREYLREPEGLDRLARAPEAELDRFRALYWQRVGEAGAVVREKYFVDKHPLNGLKLPLIARLFPHARVLLALRDPRDVILSCFRRRFGMSAPYYQLLTLPGAAALYDAVMHLTTELTDLVQLPTIEVRLEQLIADFDGEVRRICAFIGLEWSDTLRDFAARVAERNIVTPSAAQLAGGLSASGVGHWRQYRDQLAPVLPILGPWIVRFGYSAS